MDGLLGQRGELVHVDVHLHVLHAFVGAAVDGAGFADEDGFCVVGGDGGGHAQLVHVRARVDHLCKILQ